VTSLDVTVNVLTSRDAAVTSQDAVVTSRDAAVNVLTSRDAEKYRISVTEAEVRSGIIDNEARIKQVPASLFNPLMSTLEP